MRRAIALHQPTARRPLRTHVIFALFALGARQRVLGLCRHTSIFRWGSELQGLCKRDFDRFIRKSGAADCVKINGVLAPKPAFKRS